MKKKMYDIIKVIYHFFNLIKVLPQILYVKNKKNIIWCESYVKQKNGKFINNNWGDDLNKYMFEYITGQQVIFLPFTKIYPFYPVIHYSLIGSIIGFYRLDNTIIYGSGLIDPSKKLTGNPKKILSVRGPKTRLALLEKGFDCPEIYGDPALLLPLFYNPKIEKKDIITIIYNEATPKEKVDLWIAKCFFETEVRVLAMNEYENWTDVIDAIIESKYVISESLHGLIVAEAYGIPSVWVEFIEHKSFWSFKYQDFYESINKFDMKSIKASDEDLNLKINNFIMNWKPGNIEYENMLRVFPFDIRKNINA